MAYIFPGVYIQDKHLEIHGIKLASSCSIMLKILPTLPKPSSIYQLTKILLSSKIPPPIKNGLIDDRRILKTLAESNI